MASRKKSYKGRSPNVVRFVESGGTELDIRPLVSENLAAGARLAAENQSQSLVEGTARTYELRLIALEKFARENGDDAILFGPNKRPFLAATIQTYLRKYFNNMCISFFGVRRTRHNLSAGKLVPSLGLLEVCSR